VSKTDKRNRATLFRTRLTEALRRQGTSQSALARAIGVDRSTISQLLSGSGARLPNAQVVAECAAALGVSADWLLGLSDRPESAAALMDLHFSLSAAPRALVDEQIFAWHQEAEGYKIRHVAAALPDMLKTREMLEWEYRPHLGRTAAQAVGASQDRLAFLRSSRSDFEIALPFYELDTFAAGAGYYADFPLAIRQAQIAHFQALYDQLYPRLRIHIFDARKVYSAPITLFGPLLAVIYVGTHYVAFRDTERVQAFTRHFDGLVRAADVPDREVPGYFAKLSASIGGT
jgi:transcriptional regulator with XRE-family HTH domain